MKRKKGNVLSSKF